MKIIIINSKGGVGKSTTSMQVIAPFLYQHIGNKKLILLSSTMKIKIQQHSREAN
jgi:cellulose biosynthesis protein BcsQ